uniref:Uncharacterized protein n=1 Tax=Sinocyclocheilus rhinocerous TaxID=307959 RepID=A0A673JWC2_9TELE
MEPKSLIIWHSSCLPLATQSLSVSRISSHSKCLVEEQRHGLRLLRLGHQHGVAAQHHRLVLHLVPVDPGEYLGEPRVCDTVGDPVQ